jgi:acrylyl-CoA reductase (NADPH)
VSERRVEGWPESAGGFQVDTDRSEPNSPVEQGWVQLPLVSAEDASESQVLVGIAHSAINYKDALAAVAHPGVARRVPLVPGIDAAGTVLYSRSDRWAVGQTVMISDEAWGTSENGGWRQAAWVPESWLLPVPPGVGTWEAAALGTAGITAAWSVLALQEHQVFDRELPILVTGASGGVGAFAVEILAQALNQSVVAVTSKPEQTPRLKTLGAQQVLLSDDFLDRTTRPLLSTRWAGGVDTLGSVALATLLRSTADGGCVTACGLASGTDLQLTVYPFILRGVVLYGIDCTRYPQERKATMWRQLTTEWLPRRVLSETRTIGWEEIPEVVFAMLENRHSGRCVVELPALESQSTTGPSN